MKIIRLAVIALSLMLVPSIQAAPMSDKEFEQQLIKILNEKPEILFKVIEENGQAFVDAVKIASEQARVSKLESEWTKDLKIKKDIDFQGRPMLGNSTSKNTIVAYSDFLCTYCAQGAKTVEAFVNKRNDVKYIFKAMPNSEASRLAMEWFYHLYSVDAKKAWQFHDSIFANQQLFAKNPLSVIHELVKQMGYNPATVQADMKKNEKAIKERIEADILEAKTLGLEGTPNFVVNNVILRGAYPASTFEEAIKFQENK